MRVDSLIDQVVAKFIGTKHERDLKVIQPLVNKVNALAPEFEKLSDAELLEKTIQLRAQVQAKLGDLPLEDPQFKELCKEALAPALVPLRPFCGVMGVAPAEPGEFRTRPPGIFGGNMDVRELCAGAKLYLPVLNPGALFSAGDAHAAQGDGEVCINGIECPADVTVRFQLHKSRDLSAPLIESASRNETHPTDAWIAIESATDAIAAARAATSRMIDLLIEHWGFSDVHSYLLCSMVMNLRLSQVVNEPMFTVSAAIPKHVLPARKLF